MLCTLRCAAEINLKITLLFKTEHERKYLLRTDMQTMQSAPAKVSQLDLPGFDGY